MRKLRQTLEEERLFCAEVRSLLSKLIFTHFVSCWSRTQEIVEKQNTRLSTEAERTICFTNCWTIEDLGS